MFLLGSVLLLSTACKKFLDTPQYGDIIPKSSEDFAALIHSHLKELEGSDRTLIGSSRYAVEFESYTDNLNTNLSTTFDLSPYVGSDINILYYKFMTYYQNIKDFNLVLDHIPSPETALEKKLVATARSMRALSYFNLLREFSEPYNPSTAESTDGVPLVQNFDLEYLPARASQKETADFIITDLQAALSIGQSDPQYMFTDLVNKALLAKVYHWTQEWDKAVEMGESVLNEQAIVEGEAFIEQTQIGVAPKSGSVLIRAATTGSSSMFNRFKTFSRSRPVSLDLYALFTEKERDMRFVHYFDDQLLNIKSPHQWIRSEEMLFITAEAYVHKNNAEKALDLLNQFREKRIEDYSPYSMATLPQSLTGLITEDCTGAPLSPLLAAILNERRKEFFLEGDRWFELKRNGRPEFWVGFNGVKYETKAYLYTFPIRKGEIILNPKITQNKGYENL